MESSLVSPLVLFIVLRQPPSLFCSILGTISVTMSRYVKPYMLLYVSIKEFSSCGLESHGLWVKF